MVISPHENYINRLKILALHGMSKDAWKRFSDEGYKHYQVVECGYKANMMDIQAAIGLQQLKRIEKYHARREQIWKKYNKAFANLPVKLPEPPQENTKHAYHLYTVLIDKEATGITRDYFLEALTKENIGAGVHYQSIPEHPYYQKTFGFKPQDYPNAHKIGQQTVSLPLSAKLKEGDVSDVISAVTKILRAQ